MCLPAGTNDRIDRAGRETFDAPDTATFVDDRNQRRGFDTVGWVERKHFPMKQVSERSDRCTPTRRALIDLREVAGNRLRVRPAPVVATARALCLRKERVDVVGECHHVTN